MSVKRFELLNLPLINDPRGNLSFIEENRHIPFKIRRVYYLYDVPTEASRAGHGHKELQELIVAISGSFDVSLSDGYQTVKYSLNHPYQGLYVGPMVWREINNFSSGAVGVILASTDFNEADYYRDHNDFLRAVGARL